MGVDKDQTESQTSLTWENTFARSLRQIRQSQRMTQTDLARELKSEYGIAYHQPTVERVETGKRPVRLNEAFAISEILNVSIDVMVSEEVKPDVRNLSVTLDNVNRMSNDLARDFYRSIDSWILDEVRDFVNEIIFRIDRHERNNETLDNVSKWGLLWIHKLLDTVLGLYQGVRRAELIGAPSVDQDIFEYATTIGEKIDAIESVQGLSEESREFIYSIAQLNDKYSHIVEEWRQYLNQFSDIFNATSLWVIPSENNNGQR